MNKRERSLIRTIAKKYLVMLVALCMVTSLVPASAFANEDSVDQPVQSQNQDTCAPSQPQPSNPTNCNPKPSNCYPTPATYTITFVNEDGSVLQSIKVNKDDVPCYTGAIPTKPGDAQFSYTFAGWTPQICKATCDKTYTATYCKTVNKYTVTWLNEDGSVLKVDEGVPYGTVPSYTGAIPTKPGDAQYGYTFAGWTPQVSCVTGNATYTATYCKTTNKYTVTWKNEDGSVLKVDNCVPYGTTPSYKGKTPTKASDGKYNYEFAGWTPEISKVTGDVTYTATYKKTPIKCKEYTVTWKNYDGKILEVDEKVPFGAQPSYNGATPTRPSDDKYNYTFAGWTPNPCKVTGDVTYTATYCKTPKCTGYTVTWKNYDGKTLEVDEKVPQGTMPTYNGATPTRPSDEWFDYTFAGWAPVVSKVNGNATYTAVYCKTPKCKDYTITWQNDDGTALEIDENVPFGALPFYNGEIPTKESTDQFDFYFVGWTPKPSIVTKDATYTAVYKKCLRKYTVTWLDDDGTQLELDENVPYGAQPSYDGETPTKESTPQYDYTFDGWDPAVDTVTGDATYTATYKETLREYPISFVDEDGTELLVIDVPYGDTPEYTGETPTKPSTEQYDYTFDGWTPEIEPVTGAATYTATYKETLRNYTVTWLDEDGKELEFDDKVPYGTEPSYDGETPTKPSTAKYDYTFDGWDPDPATVTGDAVYTAKYVETIRCFNITYILDGGTLDGQSGTVVKTYPYGTVINLAGPPTRPGYTFQYWRGSKYDAGDEYEVVGDHTFTAIWKKNSSNNNNNNGKKASNNTAKKAAAKNLPKTGDDYNATAVLALSFFGALLLVGGIYARRRLSVKR